MPDQQLVNISLFCDSLLVRYGKRLHTCKATYNSQDKILEFYFIYDYVSDVNYKFFKYIISACDFMITDTKVLVNMDTIDILNKETDSRLGIKEEVYGKTETVNQKEEKSC